ncbi:hypothetical protein TorRG33x02_284790, partial [Trema orientale]
MPCKSTTMLLDFVSSPSIFTHSLEPNLSNLLPWWPRSLLLSLPLSLKPLLSLQPHLKPLSVSAQKPSQNPSPLSSKFQNSRPSTAHKHRHISCHAHVVLVVVSCLCSCRVMLMVVLVLVPDSYH